MGKYNELMMFMSLKWVVFFLIIFCGIVSADDVTLNYPTVANTCVLGQVVNFSYTPNVQVSDCYLYTNNSGVWVQAAANSSPSQGVLNYFMGVELSPVYTVWGVRCVNDTLDDLFSVNESFMLKDVLYCATLSETSCPSSVSLNSYGVVRTRLQNTRGFALEAQDCDVWIEDNNSNIVKAFNTMLYNQETALALDKDGNWINIVNPNVPLTDSQGYFVYEYQVSNDWAWFGDEYKTVVTCNGEKTSCLWNATKDRLPDMNNYEALGMGAAGVFVFVVLVLVVVGLVVGIMLNKIRRPSWL